MDAFWSSVYQFVRAMAAADRRRAISWWTLVLVRGLLPSAFTLSTGALVGAIRTGGPTTVPLLGVGAAFAATQVVLPIHNAVSSDLGTNLGGWLRRRVLVAALAPPAIAHLEGPELQTELARARRIDVRMDAPDTAYCMIEIAVTCCGVIAGVAQAAIVSGFRWWAGPMLAITWASTYVFLRDTAGWQAGASEELVGERRHAEYAFALAVDPPAAKEIRIFGLAPWVVNRYATRQRRVVDLFEQARRSDRQPLRYGLAPLVLANALFFWLVARDATAGRIDVESVVVFVQAAMGVSALASQNYFMFFYREAAQPVLLVPELAAKMAELGGLHVGAASADGLPRHEITFDHVEFRYTPDAPAVFDGLDLTIPAGSSLAIVGADGAGKTTLAKLLCRLYEPQDGTIRIDGVDLREIDIESWRRRLAVLFQDFIRYELSLADNVMPSRDIDPAEVSRALADANAGRLAGLDTVLSKAYVGGTELSGGEWQRVALARVLARVHAGAGVILLDEPTAQVDVRSEAQLFDRLLTAARGCTTILISHRFSTVRRADRIVVVERGRVLESGTHAELMERDGRYRHMFDLQASRFEEVP